MPDQSLNRSLAIHKGLVEVSCLINSITDYSELLQEVLHVARRVMQAEASSLFLVEGNTGALRLEMEAHGGGNFHKPGILVPQGAGIVGWVFEHRKALLIPRAYEDARFYREADLKTGFVTRSILCAPLQHGEKTIGVLQVLNPLDKEAFDAVELEGFAAYANLTATAIEKLRSVQRLREQERVDRDLAIAADIQRDLLARAIPSGLAGVRFAAHNSSAAMVGGDFYGVFPRDDGAADFVIGDVSGKGIPAALLMAQTLSALPFVFEAAEGPSAALAALNRKFSEGMIRGMFITTIAGRMIPSQRLVRLANAGHCHPLLVQQSGRTERLTIPSGLPVGITPLGDYPQTERRLEVGDRLVFFTDGLSESRRTRGGEMFETHLPEVAAGRHASVDALLERLLTAEREHRAETPLRDDLTLLVGGFE
jgi:sigma-B regulation protein RsbU (phosphoserine phosphatase)